MSKDLYNPSTKPLPAGWTPVFGGDSAGTTATPTPADTARVQNQAVQDIPPSQGVITTAGADTQRSNNAPVAVRTSESTVDKLANKSMYDMTEKDLKNNIGQLGVEMAKTTERNVIEEIEAKMGGTTAFDRDINRLMYEKTRIRSMMMGKINEYSNPYDREKLIAMEEKRIEDKIVEVQAEKQSRLGTINTALQAALEDKKNDLDAMAKLYGVYKDEVGDRREAAKLKMSMEAMALDIKKTKQEIAFNEAAMPYKLDELKSAGNSLSRNPVTGEMEVYDRNGNRVDTQLPPTTNNLLSQPDGWKPTDGKYRSDGGYECGEGANKLTGMSSTPGGNSKVGRKAAYTSKEGVPMGQVFFDGPGFDQTYGHIETVETFDPVNKVFTTTGFNKKGDGSKTVSTYSLADLQAKGVHVGFYNDTPVAKKLASSSSSSSGNNTDLERLLAGSSYTAEEKNRIRGDVQKNNLGLDEVRSIYFAPKNYGDAVRQLSFDGKEDGPTLAREMGLMSSMFPEEGQANIMQTYIRKLGDRAPVLAEELIDKGQYYYLDEKDKPRVADFANDDDLHDGVLQLIDDVGEKEAKRIINAKLTTKDGYKSGWFNDDKAYDTIQEAFDAAGYDF